MKRDIVQILTEVGAILPNSHFVGTSGRHMPAYINKDVLFLHPEQASEVGKLFAQKFKNKNIDIVVAPAVGGTILSQWTAYHLSKLKDKDILGVYTEKTLEKNQIFTRGYERFVKGKNVLVVEDLTTTGGSVKKVIESVKNHGGNVLAVGVMLNRDPQNVNADSIGVPFTALAELEVESYDAKDCPLCQQNVPINTDVGHGRKFLEENP